MKHISLVLFLCLVIISCDKDDDVDPQNLVQFKVESESEEVSRPMELIKNGSVYYLRSEFGILELFLEDISEGRYALTRSGKNYLNYSRPWCSNLGQDSLGYIEITENDKGRISAHFESELIHYSSGEIESITGEILDLEIPELDNFRKGFAHGKINNEEISYFEITHEITSGHNFYEFLRERNTNIFLYVDETMRQLGSYSFTDSIALARDDRPWIEYHDFPGAIHIGRFGNMEFEIIEYHAEEGYFVAEINGKMGSWTSQDSVTFEGFKMELPL